MNKGDNRQTGQLSILDLLAEGADKDIGKKFSPDEIQGLINALSSAKNISQERERREQKKREREERERKAKEEAERKARHIEEVTAMDLPMDWENVFSNDTRTQGIHTESIPDALVMSLTTLGCVDIEYISSVTGAACKTVIGTLKGSIYQNPETWGECFYKGWETAEEYLSGNLVRKWKTASKANDEYKGYFADNLKAIEKVLPPTVATTDI